MIVPALKSEIAELEADIRANPDPRVRKLQHLRATLAEYEPVPASTQSGFAAVEFAPVQSSVPNLPRSNGNGSFPAVAGPAAATKAARMKGYIDGVLHSAGKVHRKELLEGLITAKIMGSEKNPMQALAIFLSSHRDDYEFDGHGNYSLRVEGP
jgi:hypothetical protein